MNWKNIVEDLLKRGHTSRSLGDDIGVTGASIRALISNPRQEPRYSTGARLLELHKKTMRYKKRIK